MSGRPTVTSAFQNLRPTIMREPNRSNVSAEAEERLLATPKHQPTRTTTVTPEESKSNPGDTGSISGAQSVGGPLLLSKKRERLLLVSFRMPQALKEQLEFVAKKHEINQTDIINEAILMNLQRYM
ncbi:hypothetical protein [Granulicella arctica]|uniref:hypothetical protein n=1 Tax=Granulicella arctica TaxID=940613 RepID=UPI0021DFAFBB|nr:hypothetical protein [Granulicella arctica]